MPRKDEKRDPITGEFYPADEPHTDGQPHQGDVVHLRPNQEAERVEKYTPMPVDQILDAIKAGAGWSSPVARQAHNLKAAGSNPAPATKRPARQRLFRHRGENRGA
jgi:hypothetical protein